MLLAGLLSSAAACAVNPATGERQFMLLSEDQEIEMGRDADGQVTEAYGLYPSDELQTFVRGIGEDLAARSERPQLPWSFKVVDDPVVNAFALPRGFIFITRGILASLNSEAELAGVLGHEIGHVTARHSASQLSRQQLQQIGLGVGAAVSSDFASAAGVLSAGFQLLNLRYSRGDESQSDELGVRYMSRAGYDPNALVGVFQTLALAAGGGGRLPEWQSTHPNPENREAKIRELVASSGQDYSGYTSGRDEYLLRLDGPGVRREPPGGFLRGWPVPASGPGLRHGLSAGLEDREPEVPGGGRGEGRERHRRPHECVGAGQPRRGCARLPGPERHQRERSPPDHRPWTRGA